MTIKQQIHNWFYGENNRESNKHRLILQHSIDMRIGIELAGLVMPAPGRVWGIDISHWNRPPVDLQRMKEMYGLKFVIIKGCDGSVRSRYSADHVAAAKAAGLPWGFYDWLYPNNRVSIDAQVNAWVSQALEFNPPMGIKIDAEWTTYAGQPANPSAADLRSAHDKVRFKHKPATTYTAKGYADQYLRGFDFSREPLWVASYGGSRPLMPIGADDWLFWQFTATLDGHILDPNGNAEIDGNYFFGTQAEFETRYGADTIPPPTGDPMPDQYVKLTPTSPTEYRSVRAATMFPDVPHVFGATSTTSRIQPGNFAKALPSDFYVYTVDVVINNVLYAKTGDKWWKVYEANGSPLSGWVAEIHKGVRYLNVQEIGAPVVVPTFPPEIGVVVGGVTKLYIPKPDVS
jgi:GH25 family lysozyme M1 (1,4-beta-N-acetylmuramidase)